MRDSDSDNDEMWDIEGMANAVDLQALSEELWELKARIEANSKNIKDALAKLEAEMKEGFNARTSEPMNSEPDLTAANINVNHRLRDRGRVDI